MLESLLQNSYFSVFVIIALGFLLGNVKIKGVSLDSSAVLFVALLFGHFGVEIP
jgi:putative transport protein